MREDYAISADLCEEHGLVAPARVLRQIGEGVGEVFHVLNDEIARRADELPASSDAATARPKRLFITREAAELRSARIRAGFLRRLSFDDWRWHYDNLFTVPKDEFCRRVGAILEVKYQAPSAAAAPLIPAWATDNQAAAIAEMLRPGYFRVIRVPINPGRLDA